MFFCQNNLPIKYKKKKRREKQKVKLCAINKMSSHPQGLRFSPFSSSVQNNGNIIKQNMQPQPQQQTNQNNKKLQTQFSNSLFSGSETDVTNSLENLSMEERYVLRHTARVAPQGQENLQENTPPGNLNLLIIEKKKILFFYFFY